MQIILNGKTKTVSEEITAQQLLLDLDMAEKKLALEVNEVIVSRSTFHEYIIQPGDKVEIIHAIGGG